MAAHSCKDIDETFVPKSQNPAGKKKNIKKKKKKSNNDLIFKRKSGIKPKTKNPTRVKQWKKKIEKQHLKLCGRGRDKTEDRSDMCF